MVRATQDVDLLTEAERADDVEAELLRLGYRCLYRSADAPALATSLGELRVVSAEGLIGFKLQGFANDPQRTQDLEDIRALLRANRSGIDKEEVRGTFDSSTASCYSMSSFAKSAEPLFAAEGGVQTRRGADKEPYRALDDLMVAVARCCVRFGHNETPFPIPPRCGCRRARAATPASISRLHRAAHTISSPGHLPRRRSAPLKLGIFLAFIACLKSEQR